MKWRVVLTSQSRAARSPPSLSVLALALAFALAACPEKSAPPPSPKPRPPPVLDGGVVGVPSLERPAPKPGEVKPLPNGGHELTGHTEAILGLAFDPSGRYAATAGMDRSVRLWELESGKQLWAAGPGDEAVTVLAFDSTGEVLAAGDRGYQVRLFAVKDGALLRRRAHPDLVSSLSFSPDGKWLAVAGSNGNADVYPTQDDGPSKCELKGRTVAFTDDGKYVVQALATGALVTTRFPQCTTKKETSTGPHLPLAEASARATLVATRNGAESQVLLWDAVGGRMLGKLDQQKSNTTSVSLTPDGTRALVTSEDGRARLYDVEKREVLHTFEVGPVPFGTLSNDGKKALVASGIDARVLPLP